MARLPDGFLRMHRSAIVNLERAREIVRRQAGVEEIVMADGGACRVGRTFAKAARAAVSLPA